MTRPKVKIYGERNTGTNYLANLIDLNLCVDQLPGVVPDRVNRFQESLPNKEVIRDIYFYLTFHTNLGWKHMLVKPPDRLRRYRVCESDTFFVTLTKNPYSWLLSLYRRPYHQYWKQQPSFEEFVTLPWRSVGREHAPRHFLSPVDLWNQKNASYIRLKVELPAITVRYEDLLSNPESVILAISESFSIDWRRETFRNVHWSTKDGDKDFSYYRNYYLNEVWKQKLSPQLIEAVNTRLDMEVVEYFNYALPVLG